MNNNLLSPYKYMDQHSDNLNNWCMCASLGIKLALKKIILYPQDNQFHPMFSRFIVLLK